MKNWPQDYLDRTRKAFENINDNFIGMPTICMKHHESRFGIVYRHHLEDEKYIVYEQNGDIHDYSNIDWMLMDGWVVD